MYPSTHQFQFSYSNSPYSLQLRKSPRREMCIELFCVYKNYASQHVSGHFLYYSDIRTP